MSTRKKGRQAPTTDRAARVRGRADTDDGGHDEDSDEDACKDDLPEAASVPEAAQADTMEDLAFDSDAECEDIDTGQGTASLLTHEEVVDLARAMAHRVAGLLCRRVTDAVRIIGLPSSSKAEVAKAQAEIEAHDPRGLIRASAPESQLLDYLYGGAEAGTGLFDRMTREDATAGACRKRLIVSNLGLAATIARRFVNRGLALPDLIQEGRIGLVQGTLRFDYRKGFRFSTYVGWWIRHAIGRALDSTGREIRLSVLLNLAYGRHNKMRDTLTATLGRRPTDAEMANALGLDMEKFREMECTFSRSEPPLSLDARMRMDDGSGTEFHDVVRSAEEAPSDPAERVDDKRLIGHAKRLLETDAFTPIERDVLRQRFGIDDAEERTLKEIGTQYGRTKERIRQIQERALHRLRWFLERLPDSTA